MAITMANIEKACIRDPNQGLASATIYRFRMLVRKWEISCPGVR